MLCVVIHSRDQRSRGYLLHVAPVLELLGADHRVVDLGTEGISRPAPDTGLWIIAHPGALENAPAWLLSSLANANGVLWIGYQPASLKTGSIAKTGGIADDEISIVTASHFITAELEDRQTVRLKKKLQDGSMPLPAALDPPSRNWQRLAALGETTVLCCSEPGPRRTVCWSSWQWLDSGMLGPLSELDSMLWRSLVWAAPKPFLLRSFSRTISMRVDDCIGETGHYTNQPFQWVEAANRHGFKPWLGFFAGEMTPASIRKLGELVEAGKATAQFHGRYLYGSVYQADDPQELVRQERRSFREILGKDLPLSRYLVPHAYDFRSDLLPLARELGSDTLGLAYPLDTGGGAERADVPWLRRGPFRRDCQGTDGLPWDGKFDHPSVVYSDFLDQESDEGTFVLLVEPRGVNGYEWFNYADKEPCEPEKAIRNAVDILALSFSARVPATLFTHEDSWRGLFLASMPPEALERIFSILACILESYGARYVTMDELCQEARDRAGFRIRALDRRGDRVWVELEGKARGAASLAVFWECKGSIVEQSVKLPSFCGQTAVMLKPPGRQDAASLFGEREAPEARETDVPLMLGVRFSVQARGCIEQLRFYRSSGEPGVHAVRILDLTSGQILAEWQHESRQSGWVTVPVQHVPDVHPQHEYLVAISTNLAGKDVYPVCPWYFWRPVLSGIMRAPRQAGERWPLQESRPAAAGHFDGYFRDVIIRSAGEMA